MSPAEFLDHAADVWRDPSLFREFMRTHEFGVRAAGPAVDHMRPEGRFEIAVDAWAKRYGLMVQLSTSAYLEMGGGTDWQRLAAEFGIRRPRRLRVPDLEQARGAF